MFVILLGSMANAQDFDFGCIDYEALRLERQIEITDLSIPGFLNVFSQEKGTQDELIIQDDTGLDLIADQDLGLGRLELYSETNWAGTIGTTLPNEVLRIKNLIIAEINTAATGELTGIFADADNSPSDSQLADYPILDFKVTNLTDLNSRVAYIVNSLTANGVTVSRFNGSIFTVAMAGKTTVDVQYITNDLNGPVLFRNLYFQLVQTKYNLLHSNEDLVALRNTRKSQIQALVSSYDYIAITLEPRIGDNFINVDAFVINNDNNLVFKVTDYQSGIETIEELENAKWSDLKQDISDEVDELVRIANLPLIPTGLTIEQYNAANEAATNNNRHDFIRDLAITGVVNVSAHLFNNDGQFFTFSDPNNIHESISVNSAQFGESTLGDLTGRPFRDYYLFCILAVYQIQYPDAPALNAAEALDHIFSSTTEPGYLIDSLKAQAIARSNGSRKSLFTDLESRGNLDISASEQTVTVTNSNDSSQTRSFTISHFGEGTPTLSTLGDGIADLYFEAIRAAWNFK